MSIGDSIRQRGEPISVSTSSVSGISILIRDELLVEEIQKSDYSDYVSLSKRGKRTTCIISPVNLWRFEEELKGHNWEDDYPYWLDDSIHESEWANSNRRNYDYKGYAWMVEDNLIIQAGFVFTLNERINELPSRSVSYNHKINGWVVSQVNLSESPELSSLFEKYDILASPYLSGMMDGSSRWKEILAKQVELAKENGLRVPDIFPTERTLKEHQEQAALAMAHRRFNLLADQVGLGKGGEFISGWLTLAQNNLESDSEITPWPILIVTTSSLKEDIAAEILKWKSDAKIEVLYGFASQPINPRAEFIVTNIDLINKRQDDILEADIKAMVVDEAHMLKNPDAKRTEAAEKIADYIKTNYPDDGYITLASGTPFLNRPIELWSLLCILGVSHIFGEYIEKQMGTRKVKINTRSGFRWVEASDRRLFEIYFCDGFYDKYKNWHNGGSSHTNELNKLLLETCMIRRRKSDVMNPMPALEEHIVPMEMSDEYASEYDSAEDDFRKYMLELAKEQAEEDGTSVKDALRVVSRKLNFGEHIMKLTHLRQVVAKAKIEGTKEWIKKFMDGDLEYQDYNGDTVRVGDDPERRKLIVFAYHREVQEMLMNDPELHQYGMVYIRAGEDPEEHKRLFQEDPNIRLIICYSGAREGHTLTAAKDVFIAEIPFVPSWIIQMAGRCWARLSELYPPHEATVWYGVVPGTIDANLVSKVRMKKQSFSAIIDGEGIEELEESDVTDESSDVLLQMLLSRRKSISIAS